MRWTCTMCLALLFAPALAHAQGAGEEEPTETTADGATPEDGPATPHPGAVDDEDPPPPLQPREATQDDPMPAQGTSSVVVNEQERQLQREQEAMLEQTQESTEQDEANANESLDHEFQLGIRGGVAVPFIFALRYNDGPPCDAAGEQFCLGVGSALITFDLSFGLSADLEVVAGARIGAIGVEPTQSNNIQLLLGIRAYISPESMAKVYLAPSLVLDITDSGAVMGWGDVDFGVRGAFGVQVDILRYLGLYVELGVNILFLRSFGIGPDVQGGFQVRLP